MGKLLGLPEPEERPAWETASVASRWVAGRSGCAFAWVHLTDPLAPLEPPPPWDERFYEGRDPGGTAHPGLPSALQSSFPGIRDPAFVHASYLGEVGVVDEAIAAIAEAAGPEGRVAVVGLGGIALGPEEWLGKRFEAQTLEVPVALHGQAPLLHQTISLADVYGWLVGDDVQARPWAVDGDAWAVRAAQSWRFSANGAVTDVYPDGDDGDRARRGLMLDVEQRRLEGAREPR